MALYPVIHRIDGLKELESALKVLREQFGVRTGGIIIRGLRKGAKLIRDDARRRAPKVPAGYAPSEFHTRRKGERYRYKKVKATASKRRALLVKHIVEHAIPTNSRLAGGKPTVLVRVRAHGYTRTSTGAIRFNRPHSSPSWWWWLEFGTSKQPARPFLRPAFESQKVAAVEAMKASVRQEIEDFWKTALVSRRA